MQSRFWDFVTHYHDTRAWIPRNVVFANRTALNALPDAQRAAVMAAAATAEARGWAAARRESADRIAQLKANGMTVLEPSAELAIGLRRIGSVLAEEWQVGAGADGVAILQAYRAALGQKP